MEERENNEYQHPLDFNSQEVRDKAEELYRRAGLKIPAPETQINTVDDAILLPPGIVKNYPDPDKHLIEVIDVPWSFMTETFCFHDVSEIVSLSMLLVEQGGFSDYIAAANFMKRFRIYRVYGIKDTQDNPSGQEFHRIRQEVLGCMSENPVTFILKDLFGGYKEQVLPKGQFIYIPPFIGHAYYIQPGQMGELESIVNTNLDWRNKTTFDSYYYRDSIFDELQKLLIEKGRITI